MKQFKALRFVFFPLYFFSFFFKRDKNIWVFGAHQNRFCENSKALYQYTSQNDKIIKAIWITGDKKLIQKLHSKKLLSYYKWSIKGLYYSLKAKYYFYNVYSDDINYYTSGGAILVNLWHGIPLKKIEFDVRKGPLQKIFNSKYSFIYKFFKPYLFRNPNYVLSTSKKVSKIFSSALRVPLENCLELGYPRTDLFYDKYLTIDKEKTIIYMPTWRSEKTQFIDEAIKDFTKLNILLETKKIKLLIKLHPNDSWSQENLSNIEFIDSQVDIYDLLPLSEYLITDYSSIYFDYDTYTPGKKVYNFEELLEVLNSIESLEYNKERKKIKKDFFIYEDGSASKRVYEYFKGL